MQFFQFQTILLNCVTNDFLQQGYTLYSSPSPFHRPTTRGDPFRMPPWMTSHRPTSTPPMVIEDYAKLGFVCILDYFTFLTH
jgi:hypothetical protein